jgi:hypothetical protein
MRAIVAARPASAPAGGGGPPRFPAPRPGRLGGAAAAAAALACVVTALLAAGPAHRPDRDRILGAYGRLPLSFEPNVGQAPPGVGYIGRGPGTTIALSRGGAILQIAKTPRHAMEDLNVRFVGGDPASLSGSARLPGKASYFIGSERSRWRSGVPTFAAVGYRGLWPGIDARFYGNGSRLEYDLELSPGADPRRIGLSFPGATGLRLEAGGALAITLPSGAVVRELAPRAYQRRHGRRIAVASRFSLAGGVAGVRLGAHDPALAVTIDPAFAYSTYLGGSAFDTAGDVAVDGAGDAYIVGSSGSLNFPTTPGAYQGNLRGTANVVVTELNPAGNTILHSTYIGGGGFDQGQAIAVDSEGQAYVAGSTVSANFPTTAGAPQTSCGDAVIEGRHCSIGDAFVSKLSADGERLMFSTYLGGSEAEEAFEGGLALDPEGNAYLTGCTESSNFPTKNPLVSTFTGAHRSKPTEFCVGEGFVTKVASSGTSLAYSTYLGGSGPTVGRGIAVDSSGDAYVTGFTGSPDFPTTAGSFHPHCAEAQPGGVEPCSNISGFVTKLSPAGKGPLYSTYLGGAPDAGIGIAIDATGAAYVVGSADAADFPVTPGALQGSCGDPACGRSDAFVAKLDPSGASLQYATYLGGNGQDLPFGVAVDAAGHAYIAGYTTSTNFPLAQAAQPACGDAGCAKGDAFVTKLGASGSALEYSTYLGGSGKEQAYGIAIDPAGGAYVAGFTESVADFPLVGPLQPAYGGGLADGFVTKLAPPDTTAPTSTAAPPLCRGQVVLTVSDEPGGSGPRAVLTRLDGGPVRALATAGSPGTAALPVPEGNHLVEYWGEDAEGNQEPAHHLVAVQIDTTPPALSITSDQGFSSYEVGDHATVTVHAADATSGLVADPSRVHAPLATNAPGHFGASIAATDRCGNTAQATFPYTVIAQPVFARTVDLEARSGIVAVESPRAGAALAGRPARLSRFLGAIQVPVGSIVETSAGIVAVTAASPHGSTQVGVFSGGRFRVLQSPRGGGLVELRMIDTGPTSSCRRRSRRHAAVLGALHANANGRFRIRGRRATASARSTTAAWSVEDRCTATAVSVSQGSVRVLSLRGRHHGRVLHAGGRIKLS